MPKFAVGTKVRVVNYDDDENKDQLIDGHEGIVTSMSKSTEFISVYLQSLDGEHLFYSHELEIIE